MAVIGNIYFAWVDEEDEFNAVTHAREDEDVLRVTLSQTEGDFAKANVELRNPQAGLLRSGQKRRAFISAQVDGVTTLIFSGGLTGAPRGPLDVVASFELVAQAATWKTDLATYAQGLRTYPYFDELYVANAALLDPMEALEGRAALYHWDWTTNAVSHVSLLAGSTPDVTLTNVLDGSLSLDVTTTPKKQLTCEVTVEWTQDIYREEDLAQRLRAAFGGEVSTLTPALLEASWPGPGDKSGLDNTGYSIVASSLTKMDPPAGYVSKTYNIKGSRISHNPLGQPTPTSDGPLNVTFARTFYSPSLVLGYQRQQRRREVLTFVMTAGIQELTLDHGDDDILAFVLQDPTQPAASPWRAMYDYIVGDDVMLGDSMYQCNTAHTSGTSFWTDRTKWTAQSTNSSALGSRERGAFFATDRGQYALQHALLRARSYLVNSSRCLQLGCEVDFGDVVGIDCSSTVQVDSDDLPGGTATGKVTSITVTIDGDAGTALASLTLGCCPGTGLTHAAGTGTSTYCSTDYDAGLWQELADDEVLLGDLVYVKPLTTNYVRLSSSPIRGITVSNDFSSQQSSLKSVEYPTTRDLTAELAKYPTSVALTLDELTGSSVLQYDITVELSYPWEAPLDIDLEAS